METAQNRLPRFTTIAALRHRNYRLYWTGLVISVIGWQLLYLAQAWLVYRLTDSPFFLGLVGLCASVPTISLTLFGGALADRMNRLRLVIITQSFWAALAFILASLTASGIIEIWHILLISAVNGTIVAFDNPARQALLPALIPLRDLMNAIALSSAAWQMARIMGPAIAGMLVGFFGEAPCFYLTSLGYLVMVFALSQIRLGPAPLVAERPSLWRNLIEGLDFVRKTPLFAILISLTLLDSVFGMAYTILLPVFARDILQVGAHGLGFLMMASGLGAITGTLTIASLGDFRHRGWLVIIASGCFGAFEVLFAFSQHFYLSLAAMAAMGLSNSLYMVTVNTVLQSEVPDELRGRVMSMYGLVWSIMPLGGMVAGMIATVASAPIAVALGGGAVACFALFVAVAMPFIRNLA